MGIVLERVGELPCPLRCLLLSLFLLGTLGFDACGGFGDREAAEFVCFCASHGGLGARVASRVGHAHAEVVEADSFGPVLADQQRQVFLLVPLAHRFPLGSGCFDVLGGVDHAGIVLGVSLGSLLRPGGKCLGGAGWLAPGLAHLRPEGLGLFGCGAVLGEGLAPAKPTDCRESGTGSGLVFDGGEVGGTVVLGLNRPGSGGGSESTGG